MRTGPARGCYCVERPDDNALAALLSLAYEKRISRNAPMVRAVEGQVAVIGHSYGGDTAAGVVAGGAGVSLLVTVDPVGHSFDPAMQGLPPRPAFGDIANNASTWVNINATGDSNSPGTRSNFVAGMGHDKPSGKATYHYDVPINHNNFPAVIPIGK